MHAALARLFPDLGAADGYPIVLHQSYLGMSPVDVLHRPRQALPTGSITTVVEHSVAGLRRTILNLRLPFRY